MDTTLVSIEKVDNGYIVSWNLPFPQDKNNYLQSFQKSQKLNGKEIFTDIKKALKFIEVKML